MIVIPAMDLMGGRCVRLRRGEFAHPTVYSRDPVAVARAFERAGAGHLHLVDLDGARLGKPQHWRMFERIRRAVRMVIQAGGGLRRPSDVERLLATGVDRAVVGSMAVERPASYRRLLERHGRRIVTALDIRDGAVATRGWLRSNRGLGPAAALRRLSALGGRRFLMTDISRDGMMQGPNFSLYRSLRRQAAGPGRIRLIASGGIRNLSDLRRLARAGVEAAVIGRALYEGGIRPGEALKC